MHILIALAGVLGLPVIVVLVVFFAIVRAGTEVQYRRGKIDKPMTLFDGGPSAASSSVPTGCKRCPKCGALLSVQRTECTACGCILARGTTPTASTAAPRSIGHVSGREAEERADVQKKPSVRVGRESTIDEIAKAYALFESGAVTEDEYKRIKAELMAE